ncbi:hypothetical protein TNCV_2100671 [Trichonephila clavipes]|nr:hypothetical protein TNCV_2100671 [Trichonephila clavipes]
MPSPIQSNCDAHDTIANGQYSAVWSMGHTQQDDISVFCSCRTSNTTSPCRLLHIPVVLNDFHNRETTLFPSLTVNPMVLAAVSSALKGSTKAVLVLSTVPMSSTNSSSCTDLTKTVFRVRFYRL